MSTNRILQVQWLWHNGNYYVNKTFSPLGPWLSWKYFQYNSIQYTYHIIFNKIVSECADMVDVSTQIELFPYRNSK